VIAVAATASKSFGSPAIIPTSLFAADQIVKGGAAALGTHHERISSLYLSYIVAFEFRLHKRLRPADSGPHRLKCPILEGLNR
jgi:hypothetical protein